MNFIQTLYVDDTRDPFCDLFGWVAPEYHLMGWALSCFQLHKVYGDVTLYANSKAARLLTDTLQLPYSEVCTVHDNLSLIHPELWALPKIYTYSFQEQPFLHIDGDVFLFKSFNPDLLEGELIAQNVEVATENYYTSTQKELMRYLTYFPPCVKKDFESGIPFQSCNAGIIGGNNLLFFHDYAELAFEYVHNNADNLKHIHVNGFNTFYEQHLFYALAGDRNISVKVLIKEIVNDNGYRNLGDFHDVPFNRSYLHLLGHFKKDEHTCIQMASKLRELYPDSHDRIVKLFRDKNLWLSPCGFKNSISRSKESSSNLPPEQIDEQNNTHLKRLMFAASQCPPEIDNAMFQSDFEMFYKQLKSFLTTNKHAACIQRDITAQHGYRELFSDSKSVFNQFVVRCRETKIIESSFNWAGLFNKRYRVGSDYYSNLKIHNGQFFNMVTLEATDNGFSLYDINGLEHALFLLLSEPLSISELLKKMEIYFEDDVLQNHFEAYENIILVMLKKLVLKKAIQRYGV